MGGNIFEDLRGAQARERERQAALPFWRRVAEFIALPFQMIGAMIGLLVLIYAGKVIEGWQRWRRAVTRQR